MVRKLKNPKNRMFLLFYLENNNFKPLSGLFYPQIPVKSLIMKFIYSFLFRFGLDCLTPTATQKEIPRENLKTPTGSVLSLIFLSLIISGCGGNSDNSSKECNYYNKLKAGNAGNITAQGNQAISNLQEEVIACGFGNKSCRDMAIKNFGETHNCNQ